MSPQAAFDYQIERSREMTIEQLPAIALDLPELSCSLARKGIRTQQSDADETAVERLLQRRVLCNSRLRIVRLE